MFCLRKLLVLVLAIGAVGVQAQPLDLISISNVWRYNQSGADLSGQFHQTAYDDSAWPSGPGMLGLETNVPPPYLHPIRTPLTTSPQQITYYFRAHFNMPTNPAGLFLVVTNYVDDGLVLYLNGREGGRIRMPVSAITASTLANSAAPEGPAVLLVVPATNVVQGDNVIAVEVHQNSTNSADVVFGLALMATATPPRPDLIIWGPSSNPRFETHTFVEGDPDIHDGCGTIGTRQLLRFDTETRNIGTSDLFLGNPIGNPKFIYDPGHGHYHFIGFATYRLIDAGGMQVSTGNKVGFCLEDLARFDPGANPNAAYNCAYQGIQHGWGDIYNSALPCQFVDITGVPAGTYTLELEIDPDNRIPELNESNNIARVSVVIQAPCTGPPPNDSFAGAQLVPHRSASALGDNRCASKEAGEPDNPISLGGRSLWFRWVAPYNGTVVINSVGSGFDTILAFYQGTSLTNLTLLAFDDDAGGNFTSTLTTSVTSGTVYHISVDGFGGAEGNAVVSINPGGNNFFANCVTLTGAAGSIHGTTIGTTKEAFEPNHAGEAGGHSIWYCWTAPTSDSYVFDTVGSRFDTLLAVYTGASIAALTPVASDAGSGLPGSSRVIFSVMAGVTYAIAIDGKNGTSGITALHWRLQPRLASMSRGPGTFQFNLLTAPGESCWLDISSDTVAWTPWLRVTNDSGNLLIADPVSMDVDRRYYRARGD